MTYFAKLDENNIVTFVTVGRKEDDGKEQELTDRTGDTYKQTSYTSRGGNRINPDTGEVVSYNDHFRFNYAGIGYIYDEERDAFIPPKPFESWILNENTCLWNPPTPVPEDGNVYNWNEENLNWELVPEGE